MDQARFDDWTTVLAIGMGRRRLLAGLLGLTPLALAAAEAGGRRTKHKRACKSWERCRGRKCCATGKHCLARGRRTTCKRCPTTADPCTNALLCGRAGSTSCFCVTSLEGVKGCSAGIAVVQSGDCGSDQECTDLAGGTPALCVDVPCAFDPLGYTKVCHLKTCERPN